MKSLLVYSMWEIMENAHRKLGFLKVQYVRIVDLNSYSKPISGCVSPE